MRPVTLVLAGLLTVPVLAGPAVALAGSPVVLAAAHHGHSAASRHHVIGEVVAVDPAAKTLTVREKGKPGETTFTVDERAASMLGELKPGDQVGVRFTDRNGQLEANGIRPRGQRHKA